LILAYALRRTLTRDDAADVVAETFLQAWRRLEQAPEEGSAVRLWLYGIARKVLANHLRGKRRYQRLGIRLAEAATADAARFDVTSPDGSGSVAAAFGRLRPDEQGRAALSDPVGKQSLFEEIVRMHTAEPSVRPSQTGRRRLVTLAVAAGVAVVVASVLAITGLSGSRNRPPSAAPPNQSPSAQPTQTPERQGDVFGSGIAASCVEPYSPQTLAKRSFAFDGTVLSVGKPSASGSEVIDPYVAVVFHVNRWYRGGNGDRVTVAMFPPNVHTSVNATYDVGSRLLVSGEPRFGGVQLNDPISWACGFTRWYNETDARTWDQAFR
jgi:hypothetical protein